MARKGENIYKRKDGRWEGRYQIKYDNVKYHSIYGKSYHEVKEKLLKLKSTSVRQNKNCSLSFEAACCEWLSAAKVRLKISTLCNYQMKLDKHILPYFTKQQFASITASDIQKFIEVKLNSGLSAKYVADIVAVMKIMSKYICRVHNLTDVISDAVMPKREKKELSLFTDNQQKILCEYLKNNICNSSLCIMISLFMGLRIGEVCGLKWCDIDFEKSILTVRRTVQRINTGHGTKLHIGSPKTASSRRSIPVPDCIMSFLKMLKNKDELFILSGSRNPSEPRNLQRKFKTVLKKINLPYINYHSLRHMFATNCISLGFDVKTLSAILGHSSVETTLNRYVHSSFDRQVQCMKLIDSVA